MFLCNEVPVDWHLCEVLEFMILESITIISVTAFWLRVIAITFEFFDPYLLIHCQRFSYHGSYRNQTRLEWRKTPTFGQMKSSGYATGPWRTAPVNIQEKHRVQVAEKMRPIVSLFASL